MTARQARRLGTAGTIALILSGLIDNQPGLTLLLLIPLAAWTTYIIRNPDT